PGTARALASGWPAKKRRAEARRLSSAVSLETRRQPGEYVAAQRVVDSRKGIPVTGAGAADSAQDRAVRTEPAAAGRDGRRILVREVVKADLKARRPGDVKHRRQVDVVVRRNVRR